jgi:hypothetical protein
MNHGIQGSNIVGSVFAVGHGASLHAGSIVTASTSTSGDTEAIAAQIESLRSAGDEGDRRLLDLAAEEVRANRFQQSLLFLGKVSGAVLTSAAGTAIVDAVRNLAS